MDIDGLSDFISQIPHFEDLVHDPKLLLPHFGFYLAEVAKQAIIRPVAIEECFETARVGVPSNISRLMAQSPAFTKTRAGYQLHWKARRDIMAQLSVPKDQPKSTRQMSNSDRLRSHRDILVVYGRDEVVRTSIFQFLRSLGLNPLEWGELVKRTGKASPHVWEVLDVAFRETQVVVVVFTPDEKCQLRDALQMEAADKDVVYQPRPNVLVEAGISLAKDEDRTLLIHVGNTRLISDLAGRHVLRLNNTSESRNEFAERLDTAGCPVVRSGNDWLKIGNFEAPLRRDHVA